MTLYDLYKDIYRNTKLWKYYSDMSLPEDLLLNDDFCRNFINQFLKSGLKVPIPRDLSNKRVIHTFSVYLLGIILFHHVLCGNTYKNAECRAFLYHWFLICLYHDVGYIYENNSQWKSSDDSVKYKIRKIIEHIPRSLCSIINNENVYRYWLYRKNQILRCSHIQGVDHGISGALKMLKDLNRKHSALLSKLNREYPNEDFANQKFPGTNIHLNNNAFPFAASIIAIHNIWLGKPTDAAKYEENGIESFVGKRYDFNEDALLFWVLQIADTLEPIKKLPENLTTSEIISLLQSIELDLSPYSISISYKEQKCRFDYKSWLSNCSGMKDWTNIDVDDSSENSITLTIPQTK